MLNPVLHELCGEAVRVVGGEGVSVDGLNTSCRGPGTLSQQKSFANSVLELLIERTEERGGRHWWIEETESGCEQ